MGNREILHSDMNNFYASVECLHRPALRGKPVVVGGDEEARHGIVLAKNYIAKGFGVATGETLWQARKKCPGLIAVPPNFNLYLRYAKLARAIYNDYTDKVEPFGLDESWLDVTGDNGEVVANTIRQRVKDELGITASVGVSYNKIFAKLGSDLKKPDATTIITRDNYKSVVWPLPVEDLLYVGPSTKKKLNDRAVYTIGQLAACDQVFLRSSFGKVAESLSIFANGWDISPVKSGDEEQCIKSFGNSMTTPRDLVNDDDVKMAVYVMAESVAARLRAHGFRCGNVQIYVRDNGLESFERQAKISKLTNVSGEIANHAMELFRKNYRWINPIRSIGVRGTDLVSISAPVQLSIYGDDLQQLRMERLEKTIDSLRDRYGHHCIQRGVLLADRPLGSVNPRDDHVIHPVSFFNGAGMA